LSLRPPREKMGREENSLQKTTTGKRERKIAKRVERELQKKKKIV